MATYNISFYKEEEKELWDKFVDEKSMNGLFLSTRKFINYHPLGKFKDASICVKKGNELVCVILGCEVVDEDGKSFFAHKGTSYGGITISKNIYTSSKISDLITEIECFLMHNGFKKVFFKLVPALYQKEETTLLDYFLVNRGYKQFSELNFYIPVNRVKNDITTIFSSEKRREYKKAVANGLIFKELKDDNEIEQYYDLLVSNLRRLNVMPVHSFEDLLKIRNLFLDRVSFFGVYYNDIMIAGSMLFKYTDNIMHTQYLSSNQEFQHLFPMSFLMYHLIDRTKEDGLDILSLGISTEDRGKIINIGLASFKESVGATHCINNSYEKRFF